MDDKEIDLEKSIFADLLCPISHYILLDPVIAEDGFTYEKEEINKWFTKSSTSPLTRQSIGKSLRPNQLAKTLISNMLEKNPEYKEFQHEVFYTFDIILAKKEYDLILKRTDFMPNEFDAILTLPFDINLEKYIIHMYKSYKVTSDTLNIKNDIILKNIFKYENVVKYYIDTKRKLSCYNSNYYSNGTSSVIIMNGSVDQIMYYIETNKLNLPINLENIKELINKNYLSILKYLVEKLNYSFANFRYNDIINHLTNCDIDVTIFMYSTIVVFLSTANQNTFFINLIKNVITSKKVDKVEYFLNIITPEQITLLKSYYGSTYYKTIYESGINENILLNYVKEDCDMLYFTYKSQEFINKIFDIKPNKFVFSIKDLAIILKRSDLNLSLKDIEKYSINVTNYNMDCTIDEVNGHYLLQVYKLFDKKVTPRFQFSFNYKHINESALDISLNSEQFTYVLQKVMNLPIEYNKLVTFINRNSKENPNNVIIHNMNGENAQNIMNCMEVIDYIIKHNKIIHLSNKYHLVFQYGNYDIIKFLLKNIAPQSINSILVENLYTNKVLTEENIIKILEHITTNVPSIIINGQYLVQNKRYTTCLHYAKQNKVDNLYTLNIFTTIIKDCNESAIKLAKFIIKNKKVTITLDNFKSIMNANKISPIIGYIVMYNPSFINVLNDDVEKYKNKYCNKFNECSEWETKFNNKREKHRNVKARLQSKREKYRALKERYN